MISPDTMSFHDPVSSPVAKGTPTPTPPERPVKAASPFSRMHFFSILLIAVVASIVAWGIGESRLFRVDAQEVDIMLMGHKLRSTTAATVNAARANEAIKVFATLGALLGLAASVSGSLGSGLSRKQLSNAMISLIVGGLSGGLASFLIMPIHAHLVSKGDSEFLTSFVAHAGIWVPIGAAAGLGLGLGLNLGGKSTLSTVVGGGVGAVLAAAIYEVVGALAFPLGGTALPISTTPESRFLARILLAVVAFATALLAVTSTNSQKGAAAGGEPVKPSE